MSAGRAVAVAGRALTHRLTASSPHRILALLTLAATTPTAAPAQDRPRTYLALGDSYTIGEGVVEPHRWPDQLARMLRGTGLIVAPPRVVAKTGWTTDELAAAIDTAALAPRYDLVSLLIGVNNQYRGRDTTEYRAQFRALLGRATGLAGGDPGRVLVLSIPDWGVTPFARDRGRDPARIAAEIDAFNAIGRDEARAAGARWVDITGLSRGEARTLLAADSLHPGGTQYARWADAAVPVVLDMLPGAR